MNPNANEFIPTSELKTLWKMPFFQQRLEQLLRSQYRITNPKVDDLELLFPFPSVQATQKAKVIFLGMYNGIALRYEANRWDDPRFGMFLSVFTPTNIP